MIFKSVLGKLFRVEYVAAVYHQRAPHGLLHHRPGRQAELLPLRHKQQRIGIEQSVVHVTAIRHPVAHSSATLVHGHRA